MLFHERNRTRGLQLMLPSLAVVHATPAGHRSAENLA